MSKDNNIGIVVMPEWYEAIRDYSNDIKGEIFTALMEYRISGTEIDIKSTEAKIAFRFIKPYIDRYMQHYDDISKTRTESVRKRWQRNTSDSENIQNNTNDTNVSEKYNCTQKDKEKDKEKYIISSTAPTREDEKKEKDFERKNEDKGLAQLTLDFALTLLSEGYSNAYSEAAKAVEYNEALGWRVETVKPNGDKTVKDFSRSPMTFLKGWRPKHQRRIDAADGQLIASIIRKLNTIDWHANSGFIDGFKKAEVDGDVMTLVFTSSLCYKDINTQLQEHRDMLSQMFEVVRGRTPQVKSLKFEAKLI